MCKGAAEPPAGILRLATSSFYEAYSGHAVEVQTNYRRNCCRERVDGPPVVGVHDPPVLEMRDCLLDHPADLVDLGIKFFLPAEQLAACRLLERSDHAVADVAFIADPVLRIERQQHARFAEAVIVMAAAVDRVGDPGELPAKGAGDLDLHSGGFVLSGVEFGVKIGRASCRE